MVSAKSIGNFQANVGLFSSNLTLIVSYITAIILIIIAIVFAIMAFIPTKPSNCDDLSLLKEAKNSACSISPDFNNNNPCKIATQQFNDEQTRCNTLTKPTWLLWFLLFIPLAIIIVLIARWWFNYVHTNKTAAEIGGTLFELQTVKDLFSN